MKGWYDAATRFARTVEDRLERLRDARDEDRPPRVVPYLGYGGHEHVTVLGRVLRDPPAISAPVDARKWQNLVAALRRFGTDEVPFARVQLRIGGTTCTIAADARGHFRERVTVAPALAAATLWHDVVYTLADSRGRPSGATTVGRVLVPASTAAYGVISDIDDTVVLTGATKLLQMLQTVLLGNAHTRLPFPGVAVLYQALAAGSASKGGGGGPNPLFYVSSSPWNFFDLLIEFLELQRIPVGPLLLRDWGFDSYDSLPLRHGPHKQSAIRHILNEYPELPFMLIGDSGQEDPEIYASIVHDYPNRILAVYIRDVTNDPDRTAAINRLAEEVTHSSSTLVLATDTLAVARHAADHGWIATAAVEAVAGKVKEEKD